MPTDEFKDNGGWPHPLYIREVHRLIGEFVMKENNILGKTTLPNPIGVGSYALEAV